MEVYTYIIYSDTIYNYIHNVDVYKEAQVGAWMLKLNLAHIEPGRLKLKPGGLY